MSPQITATRAGREPGWHSALTPYIVVSDARRALDWYAEVLGGRRHGELYVNADGTIGHAEISIGGAVLMLSEPSDLWPDVPVRAPDAPATFSHTLHLEVDDVDASTERARRGGASVEREPVDQPYGRGSVIVDPFGHRWMLLRPPPRPARRRDGDVVSVTMVAPDAGRARDGGARVEREPADQPYGRSSVIVDPFGHRWILLTRPDRAAALRPGDIATADHGAS